MSEVNLNTVSKRLDSAGHHDLARKLYRAECLLSDTMHDESEDAPDWRPLLDTVRQLQMDGLRVLGLPVPTVLGEMYPAQEAPQ